MADTPITLPDSNLFEIFSDVLDEWTAESADESLIGFSIVSGDVPVNEGEVTLVENANDVKDNSDYNGTYLSPITISFKGYYSNQAAFEAEHTLVDGIAYYEISNSGSSYEENENTDKGRVYYNGSYYDVDYSNIQYGGTFAGEFGAGLFPNTSVKWKDIITNEEKERAGWPPPADDPMSRFLFSIDIDPAVDKTKSIVIKYYVKIVTETVPEPADPPADPPTDPEPSTFLNTYRTDTYTYTKVIDNTLPDMIVTALETFYNGLPEMDYTTGEIIEA
jgi:hypothetical protein